MLKSKTVLIPIITCNRHGKKIKSLIPFNNLVSIEMFFFLFCAFLVDDYSDKNLLIQIS